MSLSLVLLALNGALAAAPDCNVKALKASITDESPQVTASLYQQVAACDAKAARDNAQIAFTHILPGEQGAQAAVAAIQAGAGEVVRSWMKTQLADDRASTLAALGRSCSGNAAVVTYFVETQQKMGDTFWTERWQRGLAECREPAIQALLKTALQTPANQSDASRFGSILEVYCRNVGRQAIPTLKEVAAGTTNQDIQYHVVSAFADAAGVGSVNGMDEAAAKEAIAAIVELAPKVHPKVVDQARATVESLGDPATANNLAGVRYAAARQADGTYMWGVIAYESATCKNGKTQAILHSGSVTEKGTHWADQMLEPIKATLPAAWDLDLAARCKGQGTVEYLVTPEPVKDAAEIKAWRDQEARELKKRPSDKTTEEEEKTVKL